MVFKIDEILQTDKVKHSNFVKMIHCTHPVTFKAWLPGILLIFEDYMVFHTNPFQLEVTLWIIFSSVQNISLNSKDHKLIITTHKPLEFMVDRTKVDSAFKCISQLHKCKTLFFKIILSIFLIRFPTL